MGKLAILFYVFVGVTLGLFGAMVYLMMHVNPPPHLDHTTHHDHDHDDTTPKPHEPSKHALALIEDVQMPPATSSRLFREDDNEFKEESSKNTNITDPKKPKGRRSINQRRKNNPGVVIMKVVDDDGRPRIEVLLYPQRSNEWTMYKKNDVLGSQSHETNAVLNIMPDDTIVLENEVVSNEENCITETEKDIIDIRSPESNLNHNKNFTRLRTSNRVKLLSTRNTSSVEGYHVKVNTNMNISEEVITESNKDNVVQNSYNLLRSTIPNSNVASRNNSYIGTYQTETSKQINKVLEPNLMKALNNNERLTQFNTTTVLYITHNTPSIETYFVNVELNSSDKIHTNLNEEFIAQNTDDFNSTTLSADNGNSTSVWISEGEFREDVSNKDDLGSKKLNHNGSDAEQISDSQSTSTDANFNIDMTMNNVEVQTKSYKDVSNSNTDTIQSIWIPSTENDSQEETLRVTSNYSATYENRTETSTTLTNK